MSIWTHVAAVIRFDAMRALGITGGPLGYLPLADWPDPPAGSEGPLSVEVWENPMIEHVAAYTVTIHGDLRDYDDAATILEYLHAITSGRMIRAGVATIEVEPGPAEVYLCNTEVHAEKSETRTSWLNVATGPRRDHLGAIIHGD